VGATPAKQEEDAIDPATLPPLESLGPDSDYTVFLKKGVPEALKLAALRQAWMSDPFIRDFRSPAIDYGWDFTTPDYSLRAADNVGKMLDQIFGAEPGAPAASAPPQSAPAGPVAEEPPHDVAPPAALTLPQNEATPVPPAAAEPAQASEPAPARRRHGGALPERLE
jgi:hypothetical protein